MVHVYDQIFHKALRSRLSKIMNEQYSDSNFKMKSTINNTETFEKKNFRVKKLMIFIYLNTKVYMCKTKMEYYFYKHIKYVEALRYSKSECNYYVSIILILLDYNEKKGYRKNRLLHLQI